MVALLIGSGKPYAGAQLLPPPPDVVVFSPSQNVSQTPGSSADGYYYRVAVDVSGNINIVWLDDTPGYEAVFFSRSSDRGRTFSTAQNISNDPSGATPPEIAVDSCGSVYVVWTNGSDIAFLTRSDDGGSTFSRPMTISTNVRNSPQIAIDMNRHVYVGWEDDGFFRTAFFSQSSDAGDTFSAPVNISGPSSFGGTPLIAVDSGGNIDLFWQGGFQAFNIYFSRSIDGGATFSAGVRVSNTSDGAIPFNVALDPNNNIYVVYNTVPFGNVYLARSTDQGATFTNTNVSNSPTLSGSYTSPGNAHIAIDSSGNLDIVWQSTRGIYVTRSTDQGTTLSSSVAVASSSTVSNYDPRIALGCAGEINLVWTRASSYTSSSTYDVFFSRSTDDAATFSAPQKLSNSTGISRPFPSIALDSCGHIDIAWMDSSPGNIDIFFTQGVTARSLVGCIAQAASSQ